ncbi:Microspherule protein 1 [Glycine soja]
MEPWLPQDDFLLKNAIEGGASLESLAKGAVRFSRRFSVTELRDRWQALLYDPDVSAAARAAMANLELAKYGGGTGTGEGGGGKKRNSESIRKHYSAMQKRLRRCRHGVAGSDAKNATEGCDGKSHGLEGRVNLKGECGNGVLRLNAPNAVLRDDAKNDLKCLFNLANEDEVVFMDLVRKEVLAADKDKPSYDNVDSLLLSSPCDVQGDDDGREPLGGGCADQHCVSESGNNAGSSGAVQTPHAEQSEGFMICVLNTEDTDIPSNDTTDIPILVPELVPLKFQPIVEELGCLESIINNKKRNESDGSLEKEVVLSQSSAALQTVRQGLVPNVNSSHRPLVLGLKSENPGRNSISAVSRQNNNVNVNINSRHSRLVRATVMPASDGHLKQEETNAPSSVHAKAEEHKALSKSEAKPLSLDHEGGDIEDGDDNDNDDELPNFSDVEEMILEMDLSPMDQETNASREVLRYQLDESKRTIMRLEQSAQSSMGRAISSQGAFAVVYGRILEKYIKTSKVILGRATNDVHVDIDLGKEGQVATRISRRQAVIKLEADGSFIIKNLGKRCIFLNGKEIATGQVRGLSAGSLIEILGIPLIFETNNSCVRKFLENENEKR